MRLHPPLLLLLAFGAVAAAPSVGGGSAVAQECPNGRVSYVFVDNRSIFDTSEMDDDAPFRWAYDAANALHMETRADFVREELLLTPGDCFDPLLLRESERILRNHDFIASVDVYSVPQPDGTRHVVVDTRDEWTTKATLAVAFEDGLKFEGVELTEENFLGRGMTAGFFFRERRERRDLGLRFATPRLFSTRWDARLSAGRTRVGSFASQAFVYPFVGEVGRVAALQRYAHREVLFPYSAPDREGFSHVLLPFKREVVELSAAGRAGPPGRLSVFGLGVLRESTSYAEFPSGLEVAEGGDLSDTEPAGDVERRAVEGQVRPSAIFRVNLMVGRRNVRFIQRRGLDALNGIQDVRLGTEYGLTVGRAVGDIGSGGRDAPDDLYLRVHGFGGWAPGAWVVTSALEAEGRLVFRESPENDTFRDLLTEVDLYAYRAPADSRHTLFARLSGSGGWSVRRPFQLTLGGRTGVRGYDESDFPGARRLVLSLEDRIRFGWPAPDLFDFGVGLFADAGRIWAGDVPYGTTSSWHASAGAGLRIGFPTGTRRVMRVDVAFPLTGPRPLDRPMLRVNLTEVLGIEPGFGDPEVARSRRPAVGTDLLADAR